MSVVSPFPVSRRNGTTVITIPDGIHHLSEPFVLSHEKNVLIHAENHAVLQLSHPITGHFEDAGEGRYRVFLTERPDVFYIGDHKYHMSRFPKCDPLAMNEITSDCLDISYTSRLKNPTGAYLHALHRHLWGGFSYEVIKKESNGTLCLKGGTQNNRKLGIHPTYRYLENLLEELTEPGEWCFTPDDSMLYVIPYEGDDLSTAEIVSEHSFIQLDHCSNIRIENLTFERGARTFMQTKEPLLRSDWTIFRGGAIYFNDSRDCEINGCTINDIGSNGIFVDGDCENIHVFRCDIHDIGASAICFVGRPDCVRSPLFQYDDRQTINDIDKTPGPKSNSYPKSCTVDNCIISHVGTVEKQATGVEISMAYGITVSNCSIWDASRAGINISEGTFGGHKILGCDVFDTVRETGDHGSFNSWGRDRYWNLGGLAPEEARNYIGLDCIAPIEIAYSRFRCDRGWDIDLDDGSGIYHIHHNLCLHGGIKLREGCYRTVDHNIMPDGSLHFHVWFPNSGDIVIRNIVTDTYHSIAMPQGRWGDKIDENILHDPRSDTRTKATALAAITGDDSHSIVCRCPFHDPEHGDYSIQNDRDFADFSDFPTVFGVRDEELRAHAKEPLLPKIEMHSPDSIDFTTLTIRELVVKNIDTDEEMSLYGTPGHTGVLIVSLTETARTMYVGLENGDVILSCNGKQIHDCNGLRDCGEINQIKVLRRQIPLHLSFGDTEEFSSKQS